MTKPKKNAAPLLQPEPVIRAPKIRETIKSPAAVAKQQKKAALPEHPKYRQGTKQDILITMLKRSNGATVEEMAEAVGWQRHSIHGMMHGILRTRLGMQVASQQEQRGRVYRLA